MCSGKTERESRLFLKLRIMKESEKLMKSLTLQMVSWLLVEIWESKSLLKRYFLILSLFAFFKNKRLKKIVIDNL